MTIKVSVSRRSDRWSPDGGKVDIHNFVNLEEAINVISETTESDIKVSIASDNSNIVGLNVDYDFEVQDKKMEDDE